MSDPTKPTRRNRELTVALGKQVQDQAMVHAAGRTARLLQTGEKTFRHPDGATMVMDGWKNFMTGMGGRGDKRVYNRPSWELALTEVEAEEIYAGDPTARRIVDLMPNEATREGIEWVDPEKSAAMDEEIKRLNLWSVFREAAIFARLYGGSGILLNDGVTPIDQLMEPLQEGAKIESMVALTRWELWAYATQLQRDITKPDFGQPLRYRLFPRMTFGQTAIEVHASRIVRFDGKLLPRLLFIRNNFWHDSILTSLMESLADYKGAFASVSSALADFRIMVHKIAGLSDAVNSGNEASIRTRLAIMNEARSIMGAWAIDAEDDATFQTGTLAGLADGAKLLKDRLQGETDMPHTILFNEGPGGSLGGGQAGNHEERNWYNAVGAYQTNYIKPRLDHTLNIIANQAGGPGGTTEDHAYTFKSLWKQDEKEAADTALANAQADQIYMDAQVRSPGSVQKQRFPEEFNEMPADPDFVKPIEPEPKGKPEGGSGAAA
jgi:phage-related protein (TIGR01555 family)